MIRKFTILIILVFGFLVGKSQFIADFNANFTDGCYPLSTTFTATSTPTSATSWHWNFGNGDTSIIQSPQYTYLSPGPYTVELIISDGISSDTVTKLNYINAYPNPTANFNFSINGLTVNFFDQSSGAMLWNWDFGNIGLSTMTNPTYTYPSLDSCYNVTLIVSNINGCLSTTMQNICITNVKEFNKRHLKVYPSPLSKNQSQLHINGEVKGVNTVLGYDILGKPIQIPIVSKNSTELILETNHLSKGSYILKLLFEDDVPITKRIIVQ